MTDEISFSQRGDRITDFEIGLLARTQADLRWVLTARRLVNEIGPRPGLQALAIIFDEAGGEKTNVPTRRAFFRQLLASERRKIIHDLASRGDNWTNAAIAEVLGLSRSYVGRVLKREPDGPAGTGRA